MILVIDILPRWNNKDKEHNNDDEQGMLVRGGGPET